VKSKRQVKLALSEFGARRLALGCLALLTIAIAANSYRSVFCFLASFWYISFSISRPIVICCIACSISVISHALCLVLAELEFILLTTKTMVDSPVRALNLQAEHPAYLH
jgi:hypothetical protein